MATEFSKAETLSATIRLALNDIRMVFEDRNCKINMNTFIAYKDDSIKCEVCFAGSVMLKTFGVTLYDDIWLGKFSRTLWKKFWALDSVRSNDIVVALKSFYATYNGYTTYNGHESLPKGRDWKGIFETINCLRENKILPRRCYNGYVVSEKRFNDFVSDMTRIANVLEQLGL